MAQHGTEVYFFWEQPRNKDLVFGVIEEVLKQEGRIENRSVCFWRHDFFGDFGLYIPSPAGEIDRVQITFFGCEMLMDLATDPPASMRPQSSARYAYHFIKRLFGALDADLCCGATRMDQVSPFDLADSCLSRLFRFTKTGPQKLIKPWEEGRSIIEFGEENEFRINPCTGEPIYILHVEGELPMGRWNR